MGNGRQIRMLILACTRTSWQTNQLAKKLVTRRAASLERTPGKRIAYLYEACVDNLGSQPSLFRRLWAAIGECVR